MKKLLFFFSLLFTVFCGFAQTVPTVATQPNGFTYTLAKDYKVTSANITLGSVVVRTLYSNRPQLAGTHTDFWDGKDDNGNTLTPNLTYKEHILSNNNQYIWEGTIGNNSLNPSGADIQRGSTPISDMVPVGSNTFCGNTFAEFGQPVYYFANSSPHQRVDYKAFGTVFATAWFGCANGTYRFWAGNDYQGTHNFAYAELVSNNASATLSAGVAFTGTPPQSNYASVIDLNTTSLATGMDIQQGGSGYLFIAHKSLNQIKVYKTSDGSGSLVQTITITAPTNIKLETDGFLWVSQGTTVTKYTVNTDGTITTTGIQLTGFQRVAGLDIRSGVMAVLDGGTQQVAKFYNTTTLSLIQTIGTVGGYATSPTITNTKWYIEDTRGPLVTYIRFASDGSFWVGDSGNLRSMHYDSSGTFIESINYLSTFVTYLNGVQYGEGYNVNVCQNQNTSLFWGFLEFTGDYSQPFASRWTLTNNWGYNLPTGWQNTGTVNSVALLSNSRRYMVLNKAGNTQWMSELTSSGLRIINVQLPAFATFNTSGDGSLTVFTETNPTGNATLTYKYYPLTGFDGSGNPTYGALTTIGTLPIGYQGPLPAQRTYSVTTSGKIIVFDNSKTGPRGGGNNFHLGAYSASTFAKLWNVAPSTFTAYASRKMPLDGTYDIGNSVNVAGASVYTIGNISAYCYHGENWGGQQTGLIYIYNDCGLLEGITGFVGPQLESGNLQQSGVGYPGYFTNAQTTNLASHGGILYAYHNDESINCGISDYKISFVDTVTQVVPLTLVNRPFVQTPTRTDELQGIPDNQVSIQGTPRWSQSIADFTSGSNHFTTKSRVNTIDFSKSPDFTWFVGGSGATTYRLTDTINNRTGLSQWTLSGTLNLYSAFAGTSGQFFFDVRDNAGKTLAKFIFNTTTLTFNSSVIYTVSGQKYGFSPFVIQRKGSQIYLQINMFGTVITSSQSIFDGTASIGNPQTLNFNFALNGINRSAQIGVVELNFE